MSMISEFVEKLIGRLEEELKTAREMQTTQCTGHDGYGTPLQSKLGGEICALLKVQNIVNQLAEEYNNGWINADVESPTENGKYIVYYRKWTDGNYLPKFDETEIRILRYRNNDWVFPTYGDTEAEKDIHREVLAWQPLPHYQPKGE